MRTTTRFRGGLRTDGSATGCRAPVATTATAATFTASARRISLALIKQHPQEISLGKTDQTWFLDLVLLRGSEVQKPAEHRDVGDGDEDG